MVGFVLPPLFCISKVCPAILLPRLFVPFQLLLLLPPHLLLLPFLLEHCLAIASHMVTFSTLSLALPQVQGFGAHLWVELSTLSAVTAIAALVAIIQQLWTGKGVLVWAKGFPLERLTS